MPPAHDHHFWESVHDEGDEKVVGCPGCGGPGTPLGVLGNLAHFRCRNCGLDFYDTHNGDQS